jgi:hypothetical protein
MGRRGCIDTDDPRRDGAMTRAGLRLSTNTYEHTRYPVAFRHIHGLRHETGTWAVSYIRLCKAAASN